MDPLLESAIAWLRRQLGHESNTTLEWHAPQGLALLQERLGLTDFEAQTLFLAVAPEIDPSIGDLCARAQGGAAHPTLALAAACFDDPAWSAFAPEGALRAWQLIELALAPGRPLLTSPLSADERAVGLVRGLNQLDGRLRPYVSAMVPARPGLLSPTQSEQVDRLEAMLRAAPVEQRWPILQLTGADSVSKRLAAFSLAQRLDAELYVLPVNLLPGNVREMETLARLWHRESRLLPLLLYIDLQPLDDEGAGADLLQRLRQFLHRSDGIVLLDTHDARHDVGELEWVVPIAKPTVAEQAETWELALPEAVRDQAGHMASLFHLNTPTILRVGERVRAHGRDGGADASEREAALSASASKVALEEDLRANLWDACLEQTQPQLDLLAQRITPRATWSDIVLPPEQMAMLRIIASQVEQRKRVYDEWGFRARNNRGLGTTVLFAGESGTGKTMAAEVLANDLRLNLYRIDLSGVVSKYIGETEKNLRRLFDAAENGGAILFFDEADALFGKRTEVRDSHDRYANIEVNYLLQRLEGYQGLAILATNMKSGLDDAFTRRLRATITFRMPDEANRRLLWARAFPPATPTQNLDLEYLARSFVMTGGMVHNAALNAAFLAAARDEPVRMPTVLEAVRMELSKEDRLLNDRLFMWKEESDGE